MQEAGKQLKACLWGGISSALKTSMSKYVPVTDQLLTSAVDVRPSTAARVWEANVSTLHSHLGAERERGSRREGRLHSSFQQGRGLFPKDTQH